MTRAVVPEPVVEVPRGLPRLLAPTPETHAEHVARYGPLPELRSRAERAACITMVEQSGLRGRGGAGFPTGRKLRAVADGGRHPVVVANGAEGEPASHKDRVLLQRAPHLVIDGAAIAARAVGAPEIHFVVDRRDMEGRAALDAALRERVHEMPRPDAWRIAVLPSRYVAGEESAVVNFLNGGEAKPIAVPPRPYERGVRGRATLVQNIETLANLALIARFGAEWFGSVGTTDEPGSVLTTIMGAVARPGVYEFPLGTRFTSMIEHAGGAAEPLGALLVGGYFGTWIDVSAAESLALAHGVLRNAGATLGCGVVAALPALSCGVVETARVTRYLAAESAGQCGPCVHGLDAIASALEALAEGRARKGTVATVERWIGDVAGRGACHLPDAAVGFVRSSLAVFADDYVLHERKGRCAAVTHPPVLPLPEPMSRDRSWR
jgi:NADH:ubiquinone oxidoreductase subunit F (NADH-binding)